MEWRLVSCLLLSCSVVRAASKHVYRDVETGAPFTQEPETTPGYWDYTDEYPSGGSSPVDCGMTEFTGLTGEITSPNYPRNYPDNVNCRHSIQAVDNKVIKLTFENFEIETSREGCGYDNLTIYDGTHDEPVCTMCGEWSLPDPVILETSSAIIIFRSDRSVQKGGYKIRYEVIDPPENHENTCQRQANHPSTEPATTLNPIQCGGRIDACTAGVIQSPYYPNVYPNDAVCTWRFAAPADKRVKLTIVDFDLESNSDCGWDSLTGMYENTLGKMCGSCSGTFTSRTPTRVLAFKTDSSVTLRGFKIRYECVDQNTTRDMTVQCSNGGPDYSTESFTAEYSTEYPTDGPFTEYPEETSNPPIQCGGEIDACTARVIQSPASPNNPASYPNNALCEWTAVAPEGKRVKLTIVNFDLEYAGDCSFDSVTAIDGSNNRTLCGSCSGTHTSSTNSVTLRFKTDFSVTAGGFEVRVECVDQTTAPDTTVQCSNGFPSGGHGYGTDSYYY